MKNIFKFSSKMLFMQRCCKLESGNTKLFYVKTDTLLVYFMLKPYLIDRSIYVTGYNKCKIEVVIYCKIYNFM